MTEIGVAGTGAIGSIVAEFIKNSPGLHLSGICGVIEEQCQALAVKLDVPVLSIAELAKNSDLVVEATSAKAMPEIARAVILAGKAILVLSIGGFAFDQDLADFVVVQQGNVHIPSGGIVGIDGLLALREIGLESVEINTFKAPGSLLGAPWFQIEPNRQLLENLETPRLVFSGNALEAIKAFPANANLAVTVSLAGMGFEKTRVNITADPNARKTTQRLLATAGGCALSTEVVGSPLPANPRTSMLAAHSALAAIRKLTANIHVGT